jgi:HD-like signal output (HDOD) protein
MNENILKKIKSLPPLPKSVIEIQKITSDPDGSIGDLIKVVKEEPMLTANLLKAANSPLYGFSRQIKNVDQAVSLFGMSTVKGFAVSSAVRSSMKIDLSAYGLSETKFVSVSQLQNALVVNWYKRDRSKLDILSTASFLLEIGAVIISSILIAEGLVEEFKERLQNEDRTELEREYLETDTLSVTAEIFSYWKFDEALVNAIKFTSDLENAENNIEYLAPLAVAYTVVDLFNPLSDENIAKGIKIAEKYNLNIDALQEAIDTIK